MTPSGIRAPESGYVLREVKPGMYAVENAYSGKYEFFKGRPIVQGLNGSALKSEGRSSSIQPGCDQ